MIVVNAETVAEMELMSRVIESARFRGARLDDVRLVFIGRQPSSTVAGMLANPSRAGHAALVTRHAAANRLNCSTSTVDRLAKAGRIVKRRGQIVADTIDHYLGGVNDDR